MLDPWQPGIRVAFGLSGSGKSHVNREDVFAAARYFPIVIVDLAEEWWDLPPAMTPYAARTYSWESARDALERGQKRIVVLRPAIGTEEACVEAVCAWARVIGHGKRDLPVATAGIVIPELHNVAPVHYCPPTLLKVATAWRHTSTAFWGDSQRVSTVNHSITDNARDMRIFAQTGGPCRKRLMEIGGADLVSAIDECAMRLDRRDRGGWDQPGWHVRLGVVRRKPFPIVRR